MLKWSPSLCNSYTTRFGVINNLMSSVGILFHFTGDLQPSLQLPWKPNEEFLGLGLCSLFLPPLCFSYGRNSFSTCNLIGDHFPDNEHFSVLCTVLPCPCLWVSQTLLKEERSLEFPIPRSEDSGAEVVIISGSLEDAPWILGCKTCRLLP